jgi:hypothetical protein
MRLLIILLLSPIIAMGQQLEKTGEADSPIAKSSAVEKENAEAKGGNDGRQNAVKRAKDSTPKVIEFNPGEYTTYDYPVNLPSDM